MDQLVVYFSCFYDVTLSLDFASSIIQVHRQILQGV